MVPLNLLLQDTVLRFGILQLILKSSDFILKQIEPLLLLFGHYLKLGNQFLILSLLLFELEGDVVDAFGEANHLGCLNHLSMLSWHSLETSDLIRLHIFNILHGLIFLKQDVNLLLVGGVLTGQLGILLLGLEQLLADLFELFVMSGNHGGDLILVSILVLLSLLD